MIRSITIKNLRSIKEQTIALPRFGAIIGKNGSGKSTLIYAIEIIKLLTKGETVDTSIQRMASLPNELYNFHSNSSSCEIQIIFGSKNEEFYKLNFSITFDTEFLRNNSALSINNEKLSLISATDKDETTIYERNNEEVFWQFDDKKLPIKIASDKLALSSLGKDEVSELAKGISSYTILDFPMGYSTEFKVIKGDAPDLTSIDGIAVNLFKKDPNSFREANTVIQEIIPEFKPPEIRDLNEFWAKNEESNDGKPVTNDASTEYLVRWKESTYKKSFSLTAQSGGNLRTIALIYSLFSSKPYSLMMIDEIENGMHMERIEKLIDTVRTLAHNRKIQVLFSTHNFEILNCVLPKEVIYVTRSNEGYSQYKLLTESEEFHLVKDDLKPNDLASAKKLYDKGFFN